MFGSLCYPRPSLVLSAYRMEWVIQILLVIIYMAVTLGGKAPGCPRYTSQSLHVFQFGNVVVPLMCRGYIGPGGIGDHGEHPDCTGGIHRYIDIMLFTDDLIYHAPTCKQLYNCQ